MSKITLEITFQSNKHLNEPINFKLSSGEHWYLSADSGLFVTNLFEWLKGRKYLPGTSIALETQGRRVEGLTAVSKFIEVVRFSGQVRNTGEYYQQRYQATENDQIIKLSEFFDTNENPFYTKMLTLMGLDKLMHESLNMLSTGEYIKACIIKAACLNPLVMFIEDPYPGIDQQGTKLIDLLLEHLSVEGTSVVIVGSGIQLPPVVTHGMFIQKEKLIFSGQKKDWPVQSIENDDCIPFPLPEHDDFPFKDAFQLVDVNVSYDGREILGGINWTVAKGEKWQLAGNNGSGKSLLLSLIFADNPQVYCNHVSIFDRRRGTGESIWNVKQNIGFYSSEMFRYFDITLSVEKSIQFIVFHNSYRKKIWQQADFQFRDDLLHLFNLSDQWLTPLHELSAVNQRLVLIIGVLLRNAPLLILDEPFQQFDRQLTDKLLKLIDWYVQDRTFVLVTHNPHTIPNCVTKWYQLNEGKGDRSPG